MSTYIFLISTSPNTFWLLPCQTSFPSFPLQPGIESNEEQLTSSLSEEESELQEAITVTGRQPEEFFSDSKPTPARRSCSRTDFSEPSAGKAETEGPPMAASKQFSSAENFATRAENFTTRATSMATTQFAMASGPSALMPDQAQAPAKRARRKPSKLQENFAATPEVEKRKTKTQRNKKRKSASRRQPRSISHLGCYVPEQPPPRGMTPAAPTPAAPPRENYGNGTERQLRQLMDQTLSAAAIHGTDRLKAMLDALTHTDSPSPGSVPIGPQQGAAGSSNSSAGNTQPPARQQTAHGQHGHPQGQNLVSFQIPGPGSRAATLSHPSADLGIRVPGIASILRSALAESTGRAYARGWSLFQKFCQTKNTQVQGTMTERNVTEFLLYLKNSGVSRAQAGQHVAAIVFVSKLWGIGTISNSFLIKKILEGWRRQEPVRRNARKPITPMLLQALVKELPSLVWDNYEVKLWTVAFSLMFFGAFRNSELIPRAKVTIRASDGGLLIENIRLVKETVQIFLRLVSWSAKVIWIMRHSYIYWAHIRTKKKTSSEQMGIPRSKASIFWLGN
ncbi:uncharacterized protein LOC115085116 [Rhinatrema bivittatum]|uniref:uncharacterized protein LOC115085116 n=1 Tax=Rhinatrema bivittatum TaxID=194408 RepID=UPI0011288A99|nr:uncharacterized protein LOC115085116 [Rhinatrema bivittatum]